jgi:hypothetical protein
MKFGARSREFSRGSGPRILAGFGQTGAGVDKDLLRHAMATTIFRNVAWLPQPETPRARGKIDDRQAPSYGQKDFEFEKFINLPSLTNTPLEIAIDGHAPKARLKKAGWRLQNSFGVTVSYDAFRDYIFASRGEFSPQEHLRCNQQRRVSDRTAAYLASGRPVVMQETGFSEHLPCGEGLFAVRNAAEAATALAEIQGNYERHSKRAREIAREYLDAPKVLSKFLSALGI